MIQLRQLQQGLQFLQDPNEVAFATCEGRKMLAFTLPSRDKNQLLLILR